MGTRLGQMLSIMRLELARTFLSRRSWWVYVLAFAPVLLFVIHSVVQTRFRHQLAAEAAVHRSAPAALDKVHSGQTLDEVHAQLGTPFASNSYTEHRRGGERTRVIERYTDGQREVRLVFFDGTLRWIERMAPDDMASDALIFATVFQFYNLRLAVFFGCLGVFVNLFRGQMLDKSLHFYLLTPIRREVLLGGKFLAGLAASVVIFGGSVAAQYAAMLGQFGHATAAAYLASAGWGHLGAYIGVTALACLGYGSLFLAIGLAFRNPIVPAAAVLLWESANVFLPASLKPLSLIFYLQSLCPVAVGHETRLPPALALLLTSAEPATTPTAVLGVVIVAVLLLGWAGYLARRLEISYAVE